MSNLGAEMDVGERAVGSKLDVMVSKGTEGGDEVGGMVVKLSVAENGS